MNAETLPAVLPAPRLPMPQGFNNAGLWHLLVNVIFPVARNPAIILTAMEYCRQRGLDIIKRPINIVPVWDAERQAYTETIWPAITESEITASRSKEWSGLDAPTFGPAVTKQFLGRRKDAKRGWIDAAATVTFPAWCERTVFRTVRGARHPFTERVHWLESYARIGGGELPNNMWQKRPFDQLAKVAKAAALRAAFPEESDSSTAEEMEGATINGDLAETVDADGVVTTAPSAPSEPGEPAQDEKETLPPPPPHAIGLENGDWRVFGERLIASVRAEKQLATVDQWLELNQAMLAAMQAEVPKTHTVLMRSIAQHQASLPAEKDALEELIGNAEHPEHDQQ